MDGNKQDEIIVTEFYMGEPATALVSIAPHAKRITPALAPGPPQQRMGALCAGLADAVATAVAGGFRPVSLAVDCCSTIGVWAGLQRAGLHPALLWFDAHGDFNDWTTTPSGFLGGMPLAMLVGRGEQTLMDMAGARPMVEHNVWLCDGRDLDPGERELVAAAAIHPVRRVTDFLRQGSIPDGPLWVHFDVDVVDPTDLPAVNYPSAGGPGAEEIGRVFRALAATGRVEAVSLSSWDGPKDENGESAALAMALLSELLR